MFYKVSKQILTPKMFFSVFNSFSSSVIPVAVPNEDGLGLSKYSVIPVAVPNEDGLGLSKY